MPFQGCRINETYPQAIAPPPGFNYLFKFQKLIFFSFLCHPHRCATNKINIADLKQQKIPKKTYFLRDDSVT